MTEETARSQEPAITEGAAPDVAPVTEPSTTPVEPEGTPQATEPQVESGEASPPDVPARPKPSHERKRDARKAAMELASKVRPDTPPEPAPDGTPGESLDTEARARDPETGQFVKKEPAAEADTTSGDEAPPIADTPPPPPADGFVRVEYPEGHPLRDQGLAYVDVLEKDERAVRSLVKDPVQRRELEQRQHAIDRMKAENTQLRERLAEEKARAEVAHAASDPVTQRLLADIESKYPPEQAELIRASLEARTEQEVAERRREIIRSHDMHAAGEAFRNELVQRAPEEFHLWGNEVRDRLVPHLERYVKEVDTGVITNPSVDDFFDRVRAAYLADPTVRAKVEQWRKDQDQRIRDEAAREAREAVEREAKEREQERLLDAAQRRGTNPMGRVPRVETGVHATAVEPEQPPANETPGQRRKRLRRESIQDIAGQIAR